MEYDRVEFRSTKESRRFFSFLAKKTDSKNLKHLARKLGLQYGCLKLWAANMRTIPSNKFDAWKGKYGVPLAAFSHKKVSMHDVLKKASAKGVKNLKLRLGTDWQRIIGRRGKKSLEKRLKTEPRLRRKWRKAIISSLKEKFGESCYRELGKMGGKASVKSVPPNVMAKRREKAFRKSVGKRSIFRGCAFRSRKEIELASFLQKQSISYKYEPKLFGFYPDFLLKDKTIIEVVGFEWKPHISKTRKKIMKLLAEGYKIVVYTYPNMKKYFEDLSIAVTTDFDSLKKALGL